ncbi:acetyl-CoA synthetase-like protein [Phanerochaete sordida]|uniref:Acetyl-CoA synthetase-like protein n=1 Tax=Phanerochaete sordida TaxID=48140 RepID=A0A9P3GP64_9APHY|nr:acetyl-CoA synthetase-like protein [Phanerochaete sordida]
MAISHIAPPLDGSIRPLPGFIDFLAEHNPHGEWARLAPEGDQPYIPVTHRQYANATHRIARAFRPGGTHAHGELIAILIHTDAVLYLALIPGLVRAGFIPFPMSPRNSVPAIVNMLRKTSCTRIISQAAFAPIIAEVQAELEKEGLNLAVDELPALQQIFPDFGPAGEAAEVEPFPAPARAPTDEDILLYLHSSGSTGFPKPIPQSQAAFFQWATAPSLVAAREHGVIWGSAPLPTFHTMGIYQQFLAPIVTGHPVGLYAPKAPAAPPVPTTQNVVDACKKVGATGVAVVPSFIEAWVQSDEVVEYLKTLKILGFAGGPLSDKNGDKLVEAGVNLCSVYGGTEYGVYTRMFDADTSLGPDAPVKTRWDWAWVQFPDDRLKIRWDPQGDGSYELQFLTCKTHCPAVENLPDARGYSTSDLFIPHPTKKGLWKIVGRKDDVIVLGNGEKVVPIPQEGLITANRLVSAAVMFGRGREQCGVLIEPRPEHAVQPNDQAALVEFRNKIWPAVEEANKIAPTFARLFKETIIVTDPAKPLPRAAKGTVIRPQAMKLYAEEIANLYQVIEDSTDAKGVAPPPSWSAADVQIWLENVAQSVNGEAVSLVTDIFDQGFDSLRATFLRNRIVGALRASSDANAQKASAHVSQNFVYEHPTLQELAGVITELVKNPEHEKKDPVEEIRAMLASYTDHLPTPAHPADGTTPASPVVLLTGSTGNVGSHILASLLANKRIQRVYTLNRQSPYGSERDVLAFTERGLPRELLAQGKLVRLTGDVTQDRFGLEPEQFEEVKDHVTHIVHNAWRVDFNLSLSTFEKYISGTRRLVDLCCLLPRPVKLLFTSSVAAALNWDVSRGPIPEEILTNPEIALGTGYGASKFITENLLAKAAENGLESTILRIGQTCGPKWTGAWGTTEWVPILVKTSIVLGMLPDLQGGVSWIPMDAVATAATDFVLSSERLPALVNVVHPRLTPWRTIMDDVNTSLGLQLPLVPFDQWLGALNVVAARAASEDTERLPALKILPFLQGLASAQARATDLKLSAVEAGGTPRFDTFKLQQFSPAVRELEPLSAEHVAAWIGYWKKQGFLDV